MLDDIQFNLTDNKYVSASIETTGDIGIHLEFSSIDEKNPHFVELKQSMTGEEFVTFHSEYLKHRVYDVAIHSVIPGMFIQVICNHTPSMAKILSQDA